MDTDLPLRDRDGDGPVEEPEVASDESETPAPQTSYGRVIVQLCLILPCAVLLFPTIVFSVIEVANALRSLGPGDTGLISAALYGMGFVGVVCGVFLPEHFPWRWLGISIVVIGLPLFLAGASDMSAKLRIFGAGGELYEILVMFTGPVVVTAWNVIRLWRSRREESVE